MKIFRALIAAFIGVLVAVTLSPVIAAESNPFGLGLDKHPTAYGCTQLQTSKYWYQCKTVPKPHPEFESYAVQYVEGVGICYVNAIGKTIRNDSFGFTTKTRVDAIALQLRKKYGHETSKLDRVFPSSIWDDPDDWMMGIRKGERFYAYVWGDRGFKPVGEVAKIGVLAKAAASDAGYVRVEFAFKREPQCDAIIEKAGQDAF
ncbi:MAG: hypothetical protein OD918_10265 [Gammaproteobacteria bacterium]